MKTRTKSAALYLSPSRIEAAVVSDKLEQYQVVETPAGAIAPDGTLLDRGALSKRIKELWKEAGFRCKDVVLVLDSPKILVNHIRLPNIPLNGLSQAILSEAEQFALFREDEPIVDFFLDPSSTEGDGDGLLVCYAAASSSFVASYAEAILEAGLRLISIDPVQLAGQRGIEFLVGDNREQTVSMMLLHQRIVFSVWQEHHPRKIRELPLPERVSPSLEMVAQDYLPEIAQNLLMEGHCERDDDFVLACENPVDAMALAELSADRIPLNPVVAGSNEWPISYLTLGAALWGAPATIPSLTLTTNARRRLALSSLPFEPRRLLLVLLPVLSLLLFFGGLLSWQQNLKQNQISALRSTLALTQEEVARNRLKMATPPGEVGLMQEWMPFQKENRFSLNLLGSIRDLIPSDAWVTKMTYTSGQGLRISGGSLSHSSCLYFVEKLSRLFPVKNVKVLSIQKTGTSFQYELQAGFSSEPESEVTP